MNGVCSPMLRRHSWSKFIYFSVCCPARDGSPLQGQKQAPGFVKQRSCAHMKNGRLGCTSDRFSEALTAEGIANGAGYIKQAAVYMQPLFQCRTKHVFLRYRRARTVAIYLFTPLRAHARRKRLSYGTPRSRDRSPHHSAGCGIPARRADPHDYFLHQKISLAKELLLTTDWPIKDIADRLHVGTIHYFSRAFKRHTGESPMQFRAARRRI